MTEEQLNAIRKTKLIYTIELAVIAVIFLVIAILELTHVLTISERHHMIFNFVTLAGGLWVITDFVWVLLSKKRRSRNSLLDKIMMLPLGVYLITFDIICLVNWNALPYEVYLYGMTSAFLYIVLAYTFQAFYHFKHPIPSLVEATLLDLEEKKAKEAEQNEGSNEKQIDSQVDETKAPEKDVIEVDAVPVEDKKENE